MRMVDGVVNFVYWDGKPAIIRDKEVQVIRQFLNEHQDVELINVKLHQDEKVIVTAGPLMNQEGKIVEIKNKVAKVLIESLGYLLVATIDKAKLIPSAKS